MPFLSNLGFNFILLHLLRELAKVKLPIDMYCLSEKI